MAGLPTGVTWPGYPRVLGGWYTHGCWETGIPTGVTWPGYTHGCYMAGLYPRWEGGWYTHGRREAGIPRVVYAGYTLLVYMQVHHPGYTYHPPSSDMDHGSLLCAVCRGPGLKEEESRG